MTTDAAGHVLLPYPVIVGVKPQWIAAPCEAATADQQQYRHFDEVVRPARLILGVSDPSPPNLCSPTGAGAHEATHAVAGTLANSGWMNAGVVAGYPNGLTDDVREGVGERFGIPPETVETGHIAMLLGPGIIRGPEEMVADAGADVVLRGAAADPVNQRIMDRLAAAVEAERTWYAIHRSMAVGIQVAMDNDLKTAQAGLAPTVSAAVNSGSPVLEPGPAGEPHVPFAAPEHWREPVKDVEKSREPGP